MTGDLPEKPLGDLARHLRQLGANAKRQPTPAERILWSELRNSSLAGYKFRQQHRISGYRVDFYCASRKLIVELDGPIHLNQVAKDAERQQDLERFGYRFLRFPNDEVTGNLETVLRKIRSTLSGLTS